MSHFSFYSHLKREGATQPALNEEVINQYQHKKQKLVSKHVLQLQQKCVLEFCHSNEALRIDSNSRRIVDLNLPNREIEKHVGRIWLFLTIEEQHKLFQESKTVSTYNFLQR